MKKLKIKVRKINSSVKLPEIIKKGDWIDLRTSDNVTLGAPQAGVLKSHTVNGKTERHRDVAFDWTLIPLGVAMKLPEGFEAVVVPRSSTFKKYGVIQANSVGVIDSSYCGNWDEWRFPVISLTDTVIPKSTRVCQFRIQLSQKATLWQKIKWLLSSGVELIEVQSLSGDNRGGFGSTGTN